MDTSDTLSICGLDGWALSMARVDVGHMRVVQSNSVVVLQPIVAPCCQSTVITL